MTGREEERRKEGGKVKEWKKKEKGRRQEKGKRRRRKERNAVWGNALGGRLAAALPSLPPASDDVISFRAH